MGYSLGVDLGTTFTAAAIARDGRAEMAVLGARTAAVPSVVFMGADASEVLVGEAARRRLASDPGRVVREFKRRLGDATPIFVGDTPRSAEALMGLVLAWVVDKVSEQEGGPPARTVVTRPANWGAYRCELLEHAIRQSEVPRASMITEPEAAAVFYASTERVEPGELVAVYDLGGGTFDAALLRKTATGFEAVGTPEGIEHLGGVDFDEAIFEHVRRALGATLGGLDPDDPATLRALVRLREECTEAKEALSFDAAATVPVLLPGVQTEVVINRAELEGMIRPLVSDTIAALRRAFATAGIEPSAARAVLLVGGSSRIPVIAEMITAELGRPVAVDAHPKHAIALGAALTAYSLETGTDASAALPAGAPPPIPELDLHPEPDEPTAATDPLLLPPVTGPDELAATIEAPPEAPPVAPPGPAEAKNRKPLIIGVAAAAAVIVAIVLFAGGGGGGGDDDGGTATTVASEGTSVPTTEGDGDGGDTEPIDVPRGPPLDDELMAFTRVEGVAWNIWLADATAATTDPLTREVQVRAELPALSPDRSTVAYTINDGDNWQLWLSDTENSVERRIVEDLAPDSRATWSPDGTKIAYVSDQEGIKDLIVLDLETGESTNITNTDTEEGDPAWSPDGEFIAYWERVDGNQDIWLISPEGGDDPIRVTTDPGDDADPAWHPDPDEGLLAFASLRDDNWDIYTIDQDGDGEARLTEDLAADQDPSWAPDGERIAFESKRDAPERDDFAEIYFMQSDGSGQTRVTTFDGLDAHPAWR